jgi:hypothetical protein
LLSKFNLYRYTAGHHIMEGRWVRPKAHPPADASADLYVRGSVPDGGSSGDSGGAGDGSVIVDDYSEFWFKQPRVRKDDGDKRVWEKMYTFWAASSIHERWRVTGDTDHVAKLYPELLKNYDSWVHTHFSHRYQCMFQASHADGEENSAGLDGCRPTINAMMVAEARSLAAIGAATGAPAEEVARLAADAARWQKVLLEQLWDEGMTAFVTRTVPPPKALWAELRSERIVTYFGCLACNPTRQCPPVQGWPEGGRVPVRELQGLSSPWYFSAVPKTAEAVDKYAASFAEVRAITDRQTSVNTRFFLRACLFSLPTTLDLVSLTAAVYVQPDSLFSTPPRLFLCPQLRDPAGFGAAWGPRTCERRSPCYNFSTEAQCNWHGSSWPFETSKTLSGLANLLQGYPPQVHATHDDFVALLAQYARAHTQVRLYTLRMQLTHCLQAPGFNTWTYEVNNWFQSLLFQIQLVPLHPFAPRGGRAARDRRGPPPGRRVVGHAREAAAHHAQQPTQGPRWGAVHVECS